MPTRATPTLRTHVAARYLAGEPSLYIVPKKYVDASMTGVIYMHGAGSVALDNVDLIVYPNNSALCQALADTRPVIVPDMGGSTNAWGDDASMAKIDAAYAWVTKSQASGGGGGRPGRIILVGGSMGGIDALAWAYRNKGVVAAIILMIPIVDLNNSLSQGGTLATALNSAYSGGYSTVRDAPNHSATNFAAQLAGTAVFAYASSTDTVTPSSFVQAVTTSIGASATYQQGTGAHSDATTAAVDVPTLKAWTDGKDTAFTPSAIVPITLAQDTMVRADAAAPGSTSSGPFPWVSGGTTWAVSTNRLRPGTTPTGNRQLMIDLGAQGVNGLARKVQVDATLTTVAADAQIAMRCADSGGTTGLSDCLLLEVRGGSTTGVTIYKVSAGAVTSLATNAGTGIAAGGTYTFSLDINPVTFVLTATVTGTGLGTAITVTYTLTGAEQTQYQATAKSFIGLRTFIGGGVDDGLTSYKNLVVTSQ